MVRGDEDTADVRILRFEECKCTQGHGIKTAIVSDIEFAYVMFCDELFGLEKHGWIKERRRILVADEEAALHNNHLINSFELF